MNSWEEENEKLKQQIDKLSRYKAVIEYLEHLFVVHAHYHAISIGDLQNKIESILKGDKE